MSTEVLEKVLISTLFLSMIWGAAFALTSFVLVFNTERERLAAWCMGVAVVLFAVVVMTFTIGIILYVTGVFS